jgi:hypothetical protein
MNLLEAKKGTFMISEIRAGYFTKRSLKKKGLEEGKEIKKISEVGDAVKINVNGHKVWVSSQNVEDIIL